MVELPILFSGEMVRAILDGRKTQTRRVVKLPVSEIGKMVKYRGDWVLPCEWSPYGKSGDRLWVRETWWQWGGTEKRISYRADTLPSFAPNGGFRPSIFMPRWASRITLEVVDVRVERLQDISEEDAMAEGLTSWISDKVPDVVHYGISIPDVWETDPRLTFKRLWDSINARRGYSWITNPWVWAVEFKVATRGNLVTSGS